MNEHDPKAGRLRIPTGRLCRWCHQLLVPNRACPQTAFTQACEPEIPTEPAPPPAEDSEPDTITPCPRAHEPDSLPCDVCHGVDHHLSVPSTTSRGWRAAHPGSKP